MEAVPLEAIHELIELSGLIARESEEDYVLAAGNVVDAAFRRSLLRQLERCAARCADPAADMQKEIYALDDVLMKFASTNEIPQYREVVRMLWNEIESRQGGSSGIPFKFPTLNRFAMIERGELFVFAAQAKQGKSIMLLNCAVDLMRQGLRVLYLDSELSDRMFTGRMLAHLTGIEYARVKSGAYTDAERAKIEGALQWLEQQKTFTHKYMPVFDESGVYTLTKRVAHTQGLDVLIVDYFKDSGGGEAFETSQELGKLVDLVKNRICGDMNIAGIGAAQASASGHVALSAKIPRNASSIAMLLDKTPEEIEADGAACGNKKLWLRFNRNGEQMREGEYIDLKFNGNLIFYEEARQHAAREPY